MQRHRHLLIAVAAISLIAAPLSADEIAATQEAEAKQLAQREQAEAETNDLQKAEALSQRECVQCHFHVPGQQTATQAELTTAELLLKAIADTKCAKCHESPEAQPAGQCPATGSRCSRDAKQTRQVTYLGVSVSPLPAALRQHLDLPANIGLLVETVEAGSPAVAAGLVQYDVLVKLDAQWLVNPEQFSALVRTYQVGAEVTLEIVRGGKTEMLAAKLGQHESPLADEADRIAAVLEDVTLQAMTLKAYQAQYQSQLSELGAAEKEGERQLASKHAGAVTFLGVNTSPPPAALARQLKLTAGLMVDEVEENSPAAAAGLTSGVVLLRLDDQLLINSEQLTVLVRNHRPQDEVELQVIHEGKAVVLHAALAARPGIAAVQKDLDDAIQSRLESAYHKFDKEHASHWKADSLYDAIRLRSEPANETNDQEFLRRVYLDTVGTPPSAEEIAKFNADPNPDKRRKLVDWLLARPEAVARYNNASSLQWSDSEHSLALTTTQDGQKHLVAKDKSGKVIFEGQIAGDDKDTKLPAELAAKYWRMSQQLAAAKSRAGANSTGDNVLSQAIPRFVASETPLREVLQLINDQIGGKLAIDWKALKQASIEGDEPITLNLQNVRLGSLLKTILILAGVDRARLMVSAEDDIIVVSATDSGRD